MSLPKIKLNDQAYIELKRFYRYNPIKFAKVVCGIKPYPWQERFLTALLHDKFISRPSGHATGKTTVVAVAIAWMLLVWDNCHVKVTSATYEQLQNVLWGVFRRIVQNSAVADWFEITDTKAINKAFPNHWARPLAWSKDKPDAWAGEHSVHSVAIFDEAPDIDDTIFEAWSGSAYHAGSRTILLGQPTRLQGMLFRSSNMPEYNCEHLSSLEVPGQEEFCKAAETNYGKDSDYYRVRVLGLFPRGDNACMFVNANAKIVESIPAEEITGMPVAGLDVAGPGADETILVIRRKNVVIALYRWHFADDISLSKTRQVVVEAMQKHNCHIVAMDTNGIGYGLGQYMRENKRIQVLGVVGSKKARNDKKYFNRRAESFGTLADIWGNLRFAEGGFTNDDLRELAAQLNATRQFYDKDMRIQVLKKDEIKKELKGKSPDLADALAYSALLKVKEQPKEVVSLPGSRSRYE